MRAGKSDVARFAVFVIVVSAALGVARGAHAQDEPERFRIPVTQHEPSRGPADALVTIVAFSDFQCPFCARANATLERVLGEHPRDVRLVHRNMPLAFHTNANLAAQAALEAFAQRGNDGFWRLHALLFANQQALERAELERYAAQAGLDVTRLRRALDDGTHAAEIETDEAIARLFAVDGTPTFFINGRPLVGAQPYEEFDQLVSDELRRARDLVQRGTPRVRVYAELTRSAATERAADRPEPAAPRRTPDPTAIYSVPVGNSPVLGRADALVTIVMFTDLQCPFCQRVQATLAQLRDRYGNDVRFVLKHNPLPFHDRARPAARLLVWAASRGDVWPLHDAIFANQEHLADDDLVGFARTAGFPARGARAALSDASLDARVDEDRELASALGATGTPSFFINGRNLRGAQPLDAFVAVVDEELAKARARVASGVPRRQIYADIVASGAHTAQTIEAPAAPAAAPPDEDRVYAIAVPEGAPRRGAADGRVIVQHFSDFQCPFCSRVEPTIQQLLDHYAGRVTFVWRDYPLPFHVNAMPAAEAAREVLAQRGQEAFWRFHALLFANQQALTRDDLERYAAQIGGVDLARFQAALDSGRHRAAVQADIDAVQAAGVEIGTPSFFINGRLFEGAQPYDAFVAAIDRALSESAAAELAAHRRPPAPSDVAAIPANATRTPSGLATRVLAPGRGTRHPSDGARVEVRYTGWTTDGRAFDSSFDRGTPTILPLSGVIAGFREGLQMMVEGERRRIWIPPALGGGAQPRAGVPAGMLVFDLELVRIVEP